MVDNAPENQNLPQWWSEDAEDSQRYMYAWTALNSLRTLQQARLRNGRIYEQMYEQINVLDQRNSLRLGEFGASFDDEPNYITYNAMQVGFDTLVSKLMQADPQVKCQTDNGSFKTRQEAEIYERIIRAGFDETDYYETKEMTDLDMLLHGFGAKEHYVCPFEKKPKIARRHPLDLWMDVLEARNHPARTLYHTDLVSKAALAAEYPEQRDAIMQALLPEIPYLYEQRSVNPHDMCEFIRAWRLPSAPGAGDGRFIAFCSSAEFAYEEWDRDEFPFVFNSWQKRRRGPYPVSAAEQVAFLQRDLDRMIQRKHEAIYTMAMSMIAVDEASGIPPSVFESSGQSSILSGRFDGGSKMPTVLNFQVVPKDLQEAIMETVQQIAQVLGITAIESVGEKPSGIDSAPGLSEYVNQSGVRHFKTLKENERVTMRDAKMFLTTLQACKDEYGSVEYLVEAMGETEMIDYADIEMPPSALKITLAPANLLPQTPAGRTDRIIQLAQTGIFNPKQMARLFQSPDIMSALSDVTAGEKEIEWSIYEMTKPKGRYLGPTEHSDLVLGLDKVNAAWERCRRQGYSGEVLGRLDRWIAEALMLQQSQKQELQAQLIQQQTAQAQMAPQNAQLVPGGSGPQGPQ